MMHENRLYAEVGSWQPCLTQEHYQKNIGNALAISVWAILYHTLLWFLRLDFKLFVQIIRKSDFRSMLVMIMYVDLKLLRIIEISQRTFTESRQNLKGVVKRNSHYYIWIGIYSLWLVSIDMYPEVVMEMHFVLLSLVI